MIPGAKGLWLNLGSSGRITPGFVHLDREAIPGAAVQVCDIRLGLPFPTGAAEVVVMSHVLEHLHPFWEAPAVLREVHRVLMPGGVFRVAVPDLDKLARAYLTPGEKITGELAETQRELREYIGVAYADLPAALKFSVIAFGDNSGSPAYDGHRVIFDRDALQWILTRAGFSGFAVVEPLESRHPTLVNRYRDVQAAEEIVVEVSR